MVVKSFRGGICDAIYQYAKTNDKCLKDHDRNKESLYFKHWDVNNLYDWAMSQKLPINNFEWMEDTSHFNEDFMKNCNEEKMKDIFWKLIFNILKNYTNFTVIYIFT